VQNDNMVRYEGHVLQIPEQRHCRPSSGRVCAFTNTRTAFSQFSTARDGMAITMRTEPARSDSSGPNRRATPLRG
jgi:hypothetical protein